MGERSPPLLLRLTPDRTALTSMREPSRARIVTLPPGFDPSFMSRHALREARRERIPIEMIQLTYDEPDSVRRSD